MHLKNYFLFHPAPPSSIFFVSPCAHSTHVSDYVGAKATPPEIEILPVSMKHFFTLEDGKGQADDQYWTLRQQGRDRMPPYILM